MLTLTLEVGKLYTITFMASTYPEAMFERIRKRGYEITPNYPVKGIYQIKCEYTMQVVVFNRLKNSDILYPFAPFISRANKGELGAFKSLFLKSKDDNSDILKHLLNFSIYNALIDPDEEKEVFEMIANLTPQREQEYYDKLKDTWIVKRATQETARETAKKTRKDTLKETAKKFLENGVSVDIIVASTGLSIDEVEDLK